MLSALELKINLSEFNITCDPLYCLGSIGVFDTILFKGTVADSPTAKPNVAISNGTRWVEVDRLIFN